MILDGICYPDILFCVVKLRTTHRKCVAQQYTFKFKTREEDTSLINAFQRRNFKLDDPIEQGTSSYDQDGSRQKSQCDNESTILEKQNHLTIIRRYLSVNVFKINRK